MANRFFKLDVLTSVAIAIVLIVSAYITFGYDLMNLWITHNVGHISEIIAGIAGSLLGFVIVGVTLVFGLLDKPRLQLLRDSKQSKTVYNIYLSTISWLAVVIVLSLIEVAIGSSVRLQIHGATASSIISYFLLFALITTATRLWRCVWVIRKMAEIMIKPNDPEIIA